MRRNRRAGFFCMLMILTLLCSAFAGAQNVRVIQIWDDVNNLDESRPSDASVLVDGAVVIADNHYHEISGEEHTFIQQGIPDCYTTSGPFLTTVGDDLTAIFIHRHVPVAANRVVQNELQLTLRIRKKADWSTDEQFHFTVTFDRDLDLPYITNTGRTGRVLDGISLKADETAEITGIPPGVSWTVTEKSDKRYTASPATFSGVLSKDEEIVFENHLVTTSFAIWKEWEGTEKSIILTLYADGEEQPWEVFEKEGNKYFIDDLPKYADDGREIVYSAKETYMDGYMTMYVNKGKYENRTKAIYNGGTIINREFTNLTVQKQWVGGIGAEPEFELYQNGKKITWKQPRYIEGGVYLWEYLPKMKDGAEAEYYVIEKAMDGYAMKYENGAPYRKVSDRCYSGGTIINYKVPKTGDHSIPEWVSIACIVIGMIGVSVLLLKRRRRS